MTVPAALPQASRPHPRRRAVICAGAASPMGKAAGCGTGASPGGTAPSPSKDVAGVVQPMVRGNQLERDLHVQAFALFQEQHPKIKVDQIDAGDNYDDKTQVPAR